MEINPIYLAGVMDSDGSFTIYKEHVSDRPSCNYTCMVQLTWTLTDKSKGFMDSLVAQYGGSYFVGKSSSSKQFPNSKPVIKYCAKSKSAEFIARSVEPYLVLKRDQANNIIKAREVIRPGIRRTKEASDFLEQLWLNNRALNGKNNYDRS